MKRKPKKDLRQMTLDEIARFALRALKRVNPKRVRQGFWMARPVSDGWEHGPSEVVTRREPRFLVEPSSCIGCAVGMVLLADGPRAAADWIYRSERTTHWKAGHKAHLLLSQLSDVFENSRGPKTGLKRTVRELEKILAQGAEKWAEDCPIF